MQPDEQIARRFYEKVRNTVSGCWEWQGGTSNEGYGRIKIAGKLESATRLSYTLHVGLIPDKADICHRCDNPRCVRPSHLFAGTRSENMRDCVAKGRLNTTYKLDGQAVETIVEMVKETGLSAVGRRFSCDKNCVRRYLAKHGIRFVFAKGKQRTVEALH